VGCALLRAFERALRALLPAQPGAEVARVGHVHERQPLRAVRRAAGPPARAVELERALLELDRALVLALEHGDLAEAGERVGVLAAFEDALEARPRGLQVGRGQGGVAVAQQLVERRRRHGAGTDSM
jgi:hypothetical protein